MNFLLRKSSRNKINLQNLRLPKIGFFSTGGLGNNVTLVLVPLVAAADVAVSFIPGSPLNFQDKTLDKFESIPGVRTSFSLEEFQAQLLKVGGVMAMLPEEIARTHQDTHPFHDSSTLGTRPALIQNFILSQKSVGGTQGIVFDIKVGQDSFLKSMYEARSFVSSLKKGCDLMKIRSSFLLSDMDQPLGEAIGNSLELIEATKVLKGNGPLDVLKLALELGSEMLLLAKKSLTKTEAKSCLKKKIEGGKALRKFEEIIKAQGGNPLIINDNSLLPLAKVRKKVCSLKKGYIHEIKMNTIGLLWHELAIGHKKQGREVDSRPGFLILKKIGDRIQKEEALAEIHINETSFLPATQKKLKEAFIISEGPPDFKPLIIENIRNS